MTQTVFLVWCCRPKDRYFCTTEIDGSKFPRFLIRLVKTFLLSIQTKCPSYFPFGLKLSKLYFRGKFKQIGQII